VYEEKKEVQAADSNDNPEVAADENQPIASEEVAAN
jgi:hypothetical protein